tara:strand:+ start:520 stop:1338 length:819 start_codon:yes stop_codon:yes gene_type:complete
MCKCGCNTCETKIRGPLLTEGRVKKLVSENLQYHIDNNISLMENVFRIGSDAHLSMIKEAKKLYSRGVLDLCEEDEGLMKTHIGEFDLYENEIVPLDLPMINLEEESKEEDLLQQIRDILRDMLRGDSEREGDLEDLDVSIDSLAGYLSNQRPVDIQTKQKYLQRFNEILTERKKKKKKKEKKDPPIGKPKRGGSKAYYVYVRDPKTKRIKKVSFGSGGLRAKIRNPKARKAFAARHKCSQKNDRTKASYWSCRLPRYASQLGLGANMNTFW